MRRDPVAAQAQETARQARVAVGSTAEVTRASAGTEALGAAGASDPVTGKWQGYGLLGVTALSSFRVRG
ncbi:MAG: hypothetical protein ACK47B_11025 [Armatimonadota bacterium]